MNKSFIRNNEVLERKSSTGKFRKRRKNMSTLIARLFNVPIKILSNTINPIKNRIVTNNIADYLEKV